MIGFSVISEALNNLGDFTTWFGHQPDAKAATLVFGLIHGTGLATKILKYRISEKGVLAKLLACNVVVEGSQVLALCVNLIAMGCLDRSDRVPRRAIGVNAVIIVLSIAVMAQHITGYLLDHPH
ncbi:MAG: HupE/UreJ family protein [Pseudomonadota bacterium]